MIDALPTQRKFHTQVPGASSDRYSVHTNSFKAHHLSTEQVIEQLRTSGTLGLSAEESKLRLASFGYNRLNLKKENTVAEIILQQFKSLVVYLLLAAGFISFMLNDIAEGIAILIVIIINAAIGFFMEWQAINSLKALEQLDISQAKIIRDGDLINVPSEEISVGDLLYVEAGDIVPADARIISSNQVQAEESVLTGESLPILKHTKALPADTILAEQNNMLFKGTYITHGNAKTIVTAIANNTELGKISQLVQGAKPVSTPIEKQLQLLSKNLIWVTLVIACGIYIIGIIKGNGYFIMLETAIAMAVAAIPEGLPVVATITLARGMLRMSKRNAVVKHLASVETLGKTNVILTDKTGTLTQNRITPDIIITTRGIYDLPLSREKISKEKLAFHWLYIVAGLCNDAEINGKEKIGDPLEIALLEWTDSYYPVKKLLKRYLRLDEDPFSANTRRMGTLNKSKHGYFIAAKGATESLLKCCTLEQDCVHVNSLTTERRNAWLQKNEELSSKGFRTLAFAYKVSHEKPAGNFMSELVLLGLIAFSDPPRFNIVRSIDACKDAGVRVIMLTGDHPSTALHIAQKLHLHDGKSKVLSGKDISEYCNPGSKEKNELLKATVFARVTPEQKLDIVSLYQEKGYVVAMTGDGINDAPALKKADVGIAMGERGTEIAKESADIVLKDDSFNSIVTAIEQGRIIFENIQKSVIFLLSCNLTEVLVIAAVTFLYFLSPLTPLQILYLNLITDVLPALALGMSRGNIHIMKQPPRRRQLQIISTIQWQAIITYSIVLTLCVFCSYAYCVNYLDLGKPVANNMLFWSLALAQLWHSFNLSFERVSFFKNEIWRNKYVWISVAICVFIMAVTYLVPPLRHVLLLQHLTIYQLAIIFGTSVAPVVIIQTLKKFKLVI